jgi:cbb3-type cytochrome oxidase subunit 3
MILNFLLKNWKYLLIIVFAAIFAAIIYFLFTENKKQKAEIDRKTQNIEVLNSNYSSYKSSYNTGLKTIHGKDSIIQLNAAKVQALNYTVSEFKQFRASDVQTIRELNLKLKNVQSVTNIGTSTTSNINTKIVYVDSAKCLLFQDKFTTVSGCFKGDSINLLVENRDSLTTVISRIPKYKLLWWTWGVKAIQLDIRAQNPNTKFTYLKYIELK